MTAHSRRHSTLSTPDSGLRVRMRNVRTGLILLATFAALFAGSVIYIILYHSVR